MSEINSFSDYASKYNTNVDYSYLFGGMQTPSTGSAFNLSDYAAIKNGSYGKLLKAYYAKQDAEKASSGGDTVQKSTLMKSAADVLKKSADALNNDELWEKKKIKKKDEKTGEEIEVEDYDWEAITKAVKSFVEDYNDVVEQAGDSNSKDVLRNAVWMTGITESNENMLSKIGITVGKGNKLELDEEALKKGVKVTGATVHYVDEGMDTGEIIFQKAVDVLDTDTPQTLQRRVMEQAEWKLLPAAINMIANKDTDKQTD